MKAQLGLCSQRRARAALDVPRYRRRSVRELGIWISEGLTRAEARCSEVGFPGP